MLEAIAVVVSIVALLTGAALEPVTGIRVGLFVATASLILGSVAGAVYHWRLRAVLLARGALRRRWWINPVALHRALDEPERDHVLPPFYLGALGFAGAVFGCTTMVSALIRILL